MSVPFAPVLPPLRPATLAAFEARLAGVPSPSQTASDGQGAVPLVSGADDRPLFLSSAGAALAATLPAIPAAPPARPPRKRQRVHQVTIDTAPRWEIDRTAARRALDSAIEADRSTGDPSPLALRAVLSALLDKASKAGGGVAQMSARRLGRWAKVCTDTARRCRDWLEDHGLVAVIVARVRDVKGAITRIVNGAAAVIFPEAMRAESSPPVSGRSSPPVRKGGEEDIRPAQARGILSRWLDHIGAVARPSRWVNLTRSARAPP